MDINVTCASSETLRFAGSELCFYLKRMLPGDGPDMTFTLLSEGNARANDAFTLAVTPRGGTIRGSSDRAVLLGVYDLLHALGCRFLAPGRDNEYVPSIRAEDMALAYEKTASFYHRGVCIEGADSRENILDFIDWLPKAGYNAFFFQFKLPYAFLSRWYHHENNPLREPEPCGPADAAVVMTEAEREIKRRGLMLHKVGHGWTGEVLGYEALSWSPDRQPLGEDKRPFAALMDGQRGIYRLIPCNTNLCLSNSEGLERFAALVVQYARENPEADYLHVWLADDYNNVCECDRCRETTVSDQYVALLNEIDRRLTGLGLDTKLVFLLYQELLWPPVGERLKNKERFVMMFAPISRTFEASYREQTRAASMPPYVRNQITLPGDLGENLAFLRAWQEQFDGDGFVYDYPLGRAHYGDFGYVHIARIIHSDIRALRQLGLEGYISCQELRAGLPNFLPNYVMGRTLMDENEDIEALIKEYFDAAYGEDAPGAYAFLAELSRLGSRDYINGKGPRVDDDIARRMGEAAALCEQFLAGSLKRSEGFWERLCYHAEYILRFARALEALAKGDEARAGELWREMQDFICRHEPAYQPWLDVYRVMEVTEKYTGFKT